MADKVEAKRITAEELNKVFSFELETGQTKDKKDYTYLSIKRRATGRQVKQIFLNYDVTATLEQIVEALNEK